MALTSGAKAHEQRKATQARTGKRTVPGEAIGEQLRRAYADVLAEPVPDKITDLVRQLEKRERGNR